MIIEYGDVAMFHFHSGMTVARCCISQRATTARTEPRPPGLSHGHDGADGAAPSRAFPTGMTVLIEII